MESRGIQPPALQLNTVIVIFSIPPQTHKHTPHNNWVMRTYTLTHRKLVGFSDGDARIIPTSPFSTVSSVVRAACRCVYVCVCVLHVRLSLSVPLCVREMVNTFQMCEAFAITIWAHGNRSDRAVASWRRSSLVTLPTV